MTHWQAIVSRSGLGAAPWWCGLALSLLALAPGVSNAQDVQPPRIETIEVGFNGVFKVGCWTQMLVRLGGGSESITGRLEVRVADTDGVPTTFHTPSNRPVGVTTQQTSTARLFIRPGQTGGTLRVRFVDGTGKVRAEKTYYSGPEPTESVIVGGLPSIDRVVVAMGPPVGLGELIRASSAATPDAGSTHVAQIPSPEWMPFEWYGYECVDTVVVSCSDASWFRPLPEESERIGALLRWVELGGHAVVFCGRNAAELIGPGGPLARLAPGKFSEMAPLRTALPFESYAGAEDSINRGRIDLRVPKLTDVEGLILAHDGPRPEDLPLIIRTRRKLGQITFLAMDPAVSPLADWPGRVSLLRKALAWPAPLVGAQETQNNAYAGQGFEDLTGQIRTALDGKFIGVEPAPFGLVALLVVGYIALIGPGDYFLVKRVFKRMEMTWITFPLMAVLVSAGAYWLAITMKGDQLRVNQVEIVDVDLASGEARGTVWTHFFSPRAESYTLTLTPRFADRAVTEQAETLTSWLGMPGPGLGGMQSGVAQAAIFSRGYQFDPTLTAIRRMPVQEWSTKTLAGRWTGNVGEPLRVRLQPDVEDLVAGEITNQSGIVLQDCLLFYGRWAYRLGDLAEGAAVVVDQSLQPRTIKTQLTSTSAGDVTSVDAAEDGTVEFDLYGADVARLAKLMMFFEGAGGRTYAPIWNRYQHFVEMSRLLNSGQAILLARVREVAGSQWNDGEQPLSSKSDLNWTFYRFVIPVKKARQITVPRPSNAQTRP